MAAINKKTIIIKNVTVFYLYLILLWGFYRLLFQLPAALEELLVKPLLWLAPITYFLTKERKGLKSLGIQAGNFSSSIYYFLILGLIFALEGFALNYIKYHSFQFDANLGQNFTTALVLSFVTASVEEITFRGYIFTRLWYALGNEVSANLTTATAWMFIHFPVALFVWKFDLINLSTYLFLVFLFSLGSSFLFARTKNIFLSIFLHFLWQWPIILFR
jgi:membrane protease YdiL (CAAX protease family)